MLDTETLEKTISCCYADGKVELAENLRKEKEKIEYIEELKEEIDKKYKQGYSYLDIVKEFKYNQYHTIINEDVFLVFISDIVIIFEHSTYQIKG